MITTHALSPDTEATLLLCGRFAKGEQATAPLTTSEYNRLAGWLLGEGMRPADLLGGEARQVLERGNPPVAAPRLLELLDRGGAMGLALEGWLNKGLWVIGRGDEEYPARLRASKGSPPLLYGAGEKALLPGGGLAIVGSRDADEAALLFTREVAGACARQGVRVVSGGARGVDAEAMLACVGAGGSSVGVLADSLRRAALSGRYRDALTRGRLAFVSPYDPASGFSAGNAMGRNRYIYALADHALVVSSDTRGGAWEGALEALKDGGTPVFVRAGDGAPEGNRRLLDKGAAAFPGGPWTDLLDALAGAAGSGRAEQQALLLPE